MTDPELKELFTDPADREVVELLKASRPSAPPLDPNFRNYLRTKLMAEARRTLPRRERAPGFTWRMPNTVLALAAVAAGFVVVLGISVYLQRNGNSPVAVVADIRLVNNNMARAISIVSWERGRDPRDFAMVSFGGAGPVHACDLAEELGIRAIIAPAHAGLFSAYGLLAGDLSRTFTLPVLSGRSQLSTYFGELEKLASEEMKLDGFRKFSTEGYVEARYAGQSHELTLPFAGEAKLRSSFDVRHRELYGYSSSDPLEVVSVRLRAVVHRKKPRVARSTWERATEVRRIRRAWFAGRRQSAHVFTRERMRPGDRGVGPCIIEEYDSTLVVNPGWKWSTEEYGTRLSR